MSSWEIIEDIMAQRTWVRKLVFLAALTPTSLYGLGKALEKMGVTHRRTAITVASELTAKEIGRKKLPEPLLKVVRVEVVKNRARKIVQANLEYVLKVFCEELAEAPDLYEDFLIAVNEWKEKVRVREEKIPKEIIDLAKAISFSGLIITILASAVYNSEKLPADKKKKLYAAILKAASKAFLEKPEKLMSVVLVFSKAQKIGVPKEYADVLFDIIEKVLGTKK